MSVYVIGNAFISEKVLYINPTIWVHTETLIGSYKSNLWEGSHSWHLGTWKSWQLV